MLQTNSKSTILFLSLLLASVNAFITNQRQIAFSKKHYKISSCTCTETAKMMTSSSSRSESNNEEEKELTNNDTNTKPKVIVFDLDGCLWRPEMYEILYYSGGRGAPFRSDPDNVGQLLTCGNEPVYLLGDVRQVMRQLHYESKWDNVLVGISSRTDEPTWARELLTKFDLHVDDGEKEQATTSQSATLSDVFKGGPIEIAHDSKVQHFQRISKQTGIKLEDMLFFDNESGNCREVAKLGVTVAYTPDGVTQQMFNVALEAFPQTLGDVVGIDVYGYDTLEGANRFF